MYNQHTRGMATTRHRSLVGRSEGRGCVRDRPSNFFLFFQHTDISNLKRFEQIELQAKLLNYFLGSNKSNINQAKLKLILKQDLDLDLDVPKFNFYVPGNRLDTNQARALSKDTFASQQSFSDLAAMDVGVSRKGLRVAGVPVGDDTWVTKFVAEKVEAVILDVGKIDHVLTDGTIHYHMLRFCKNTHPGFLARNMPTPLISDSLGSLESFWSPCAPKALVALIQIGHPSCDPSLT